MLAHPRAQRKDVHIYYLHDYRDARSSSCLTPEICSTRQEAELGNRIFGLFSLTRELPLFYCPPPK